MTLSCVTYM